MLKNFIKTAIRNFRAGKSYSVINIACLSFGLACSLIAMLYISHITGYDRFHENYDRLYSVEAYVTYFNGDRFPKQYLSASLADVLKTNAPEIDKVTRIAERTHSFSAGDRDFDINGICADNNFFGIFSFPVLSSSASDLPDDPGTIFISEKAASRFFGTTDCIGKTIISKNDSKETFIVMGVFNNIPAQSLLQFDFVMPFSKYLLDNSDAMDPGATSNQTWILLDERSHRSTVENKIRGLISNQESTLHQELFLFPLKEKILYSYADGRRTWKEMQKVVVAGAIGLAILLIACFNFINLSIALNYRRCRETGVRKVFGSDRKTVILQFLVEALLITFISLGIAIILALILLAGFNTAFHYDLKPAMVSFRILFFLSGILTFTAFVSGLLPAIQLASTDPVETLKGKPVKTHNFSLFRKSLVIFQFMIPFALIICLTIIFQQDKYMSEYYAGIDKDRVFVLENTGGISNHQDEFKAELFSIPGIEAVSFTSCIPTRGTRVSSEVSWEGRDPEKKLHFWCVSADFDYNKTVDVNITAGRYFDKALRTDSACYIINDVAARVMDCLNPVGSWLTVEGKKGMVIGVFTGFHSIDLAGPIVPTIIRPGSGKETYLLIRYNAGSYFELRDKITGVYNRFETEAPIHLSLFRDLPEYSDLGLASGLSGTAFIIALLLACAGLFGLASFTAESRTKEIGIRKANGATTASVMRLLLAGYTKWLIAAYLISLPVAFIFGRLFIARFNFHTSLATWFFVAGPVLTFAMALIAVFSKTWRAANTNPVNSLRYE